MFYKVYIIFYNGFFRRGFLSVRVFFRRLIIIDGICYIIGVFRDIGRVRDIFMMGRWWIIGRGVFFKSIWTWFCVLFRLGFRIWIFIGSFGCSFIFGDFVVIRRVFFYRFVFWFWFGWICCCFVLIGFVWFIVWFYSFFYWTIIFWRICFCRVIWIFREISRFSFFVFCRYRFFCFWFFWNL